MKTLRKPNKVNDVLSFKARKKAIELLGEQKYIRYFHENEYTIYVTDTRRGRVRAKNKTLTIPLWCINKPESGNAIHKLGYDGKLLSSFWIYYLAHEISHVISESHNHDAVFMKTFIQICPPELQFFEIGYKPRSAQAAGINLIK